jgi:uncharacterized protein YdbL (DUF1318 family)
MEMTFYFHRNNIIGVVTLLFAFLLSCSAYAADLSSAKQAGLIGEQSNGYLGFVSGAIPADVRALVIDVNQKRKSHYQAIANKNALPLAKVEVLAGKKAIAKTLKQQFIRLPSGQWKHK